METNNGTQVNSPDETTVGLHVRLDPPRIAQYINIKKEDTNDVMTICEIESQCDVLTGNCNECEPGWYPPTCETACSQGYYGQDCSKECSHNCVDNNCNSQNGSCVHGCKPGYDYTMSTNCLVDEKGERRFTASEVAGVAGGSVGSCLLFLGLVFASVLGYRRYKSASSKTDSTNVISDVENTNTGRAYEGPYEMSLKNNDEHIYQKI
ncbi:SREC-like protein [Mya arenaria]|uniref:SREC-like protein n=1 Tax=Mya arenaria TaxID=6604 RepID=A0ABY7DR11_MYAAR|nr:SREC-like protein [Mya arenaria]